VAETQNIDALLDDPLKEITRKERKLLLAVSVLGIFLVKTGLIPTQISALGIQFTQTNQKGFLWVVSVVDIYFLCAFIIYATSDFLAWRKALLQEFKSEFQEYYDKQAKLIQQEEADLYAPLGENFLESQLNDLKESIERDENRYKISFTKLKKFSWYISLIRVFFEFGLPVFVGIYSIFQLYYH
jgi:hypothetical protein